MFADSTDLYVKAGNGGDGAVAFHREKYVAAGGPDGGDGGKGGDVILITADNLNTLADLRFKHRFIAENGENGKGSKMFGKNGKDLIIKVPKGTVVKDKKTGLVIKDMSDDKPFIIARGGRGGWGNRHFATPTRQAPRFAKPGIPGEEKEIILELKMIADVGLIGFPNVGKSTLLSISSSAKPKIANYHFTTLTPSLGVVKVGDENSFIMADIPGIIEGASDGQGLGHEFLKHVERCRLLLHVIDISGSEGRDPIEDYKAINRELRNFSELLASCPQIVVGNKADIIINEETAENFRKFVKKEEIEYYEISAVAHTGLQELLFKVYDKVSKLPPIKVYESEFEENPSEIKDAGDITITVKDGVYIVKGERLLYIMRGINFDDYESLQYFQKILNVSGVIDKLRDAGIKEGDTVSIYDFEFDFVL